MSGANRPGLLTAITAAFRDLNLEVGKADVQGDESKIADKFYVRYPEGGKIEEDSQIASIQKALETLLRSRSTGPVSTRPKFSTVSIQQDANKRELLYTLMGERAARA